MKTTNIKKLEKGKYEIRFSYIDSLTGERRRIRRVFEGSLQDAKIERDRLKYLASSGQIDSPSETRKDEPLASWIGEYLIHREVRDKVARSTLKGEKTILNGAIMRDCADWKPSGIRTFHLDRLLASWLQETSVKTNDLLSPTTVKNRMGTMKRFLRWVFKQMDLDLGILRDIDLIRVTKSTKRGRVMTPEEAQAFLDGMLERFPHWYALFLTLLLTGQRIGSVTALRWAEDVDLIDKTLTFNQSHYLGTVREGNKTNQVVRMPIPDHLVSVLLDHKERCLKEAWRGFNTDLVFYSRTPKDQSPTEGYIISGDLRSAIRNVCESVGIDYVSPHDLRRTFNSWLVEEGVSGTILRSLTGHTTESMTDHYYHGSKDAKIKAVDKITALVTSNSKGK